MLLHTKLINIFDSYNGIIKIEVQKNYNLPSILSYENEKIYEGMSDTNKCTLLVEEKMDQLTYKGHEPFINADIEGERICEIHRPSENIVKSESYVINIFLKSQM